MSISSTITTVTNVKALVEDEKEGYSSTGTGQAVAVSIMQLSLSLSLSSVSVFLLVRGSGQAVTLAFDTLWWHLYLMAHTFDGTII